MGQTKLRRAFASTLNSIGVSPPIWKSKKNYLVAIDYHYFTNGVVKNEDLEVSLSVLDKQLSSIKKTCDLVSIDSFMQGKRGSKQQLTITIDDADKSLLEALPAFEKYEIPFSLYVPVGLCLPDHEIDGLKSRVLRMFFESESRADTPHNFFKNVDSASVEDLQKIKKSLEAAAKTRDPISYKNLLDLEGLRKLASHPLVTLGSHTMSHPVLAEISEDWAEWEIKTSLDYLRNLGAKAQTFAYPYGFKTSFNPSTKQILSKHGVKFAFTTMSKVTTSSTDPLEVGRIGMLNFSDEKYLKGVFGGAFEYWDRLLGRL